MVAVTTSAPLACAFSASPRRSPTHPKKFGYPRTTQATGSPWSFASTSRRSTAPSAPSDKVSIWAEPPGSPWT